ncbi:MAG: FAD-binding oxidoreductase [Planctomycetota bacterium]
MSATILPTSREELATCLRDHEGPLRIVGSGSRQGRLPARDDAARLDLSALAGIERLDAADQTCSVQTGVRREALDEALAAHDLWLPCAGTGTLGGIFAADDVGPLGPGSPSPRSLLLGMEAVLADGTPFRSGARVVKSVAGFDLHKLFVGSQGRLFAADVLHLRLRPRPRASVHFARTGLDADRALQLFTALRGEALPPAALHLAGAGNAFAVHGRFDGRPAFVAAAQRAHALAEAAPFPLLHLDAAAPAEVSAGALAPSQVPALLAAAPDLLRFVLHGGGRFELALPDAASTDRALPRFAAAGIHAVVVGGADDRRGRATPLDHGHERLAGALRAALDPDGTFV